jgi:hypothetical protein
MSATRHLFEAARHRHTATANAREADRRERDALDEGKAQLRYWSPEQVLAVLASAERVIADLRGTVVSS